MGNCIESLVKMQVGEIRGPQEEEGGGGGGGGFVKEENGNGEGGMMRIKILLTKEELEWMMFQLKDKSKGKRLEDVLEEIGRGRGKLAEAEAWKPSLDSIMESPEVPDHLDR